MWHYYVKLCSFTLKTNNDKHKLVTNHSFISLNLHQIYENKYKVSDYLSF